MRRWLAIAFLVLLANSAYIGAFATPSIFYMGNVFAHTVLGLALAGVFVWLLAKEGGLRRSLRWAAPVLLACAALGIYLVYASVKGAYSGDELRSKWALFGHIVAGFLGSALLLAWRPHPRFGRAVAALTALGVLLPAVTWTAGMLFPDPRNRIRNPVSVPVSMEQEGAGPKSPFWPSSANTNVNGTIPSHFFLDSKLCGECHKDIPKPNNHLMA